MCDAGQASMAYFYFDFRDIDKQLLRHLVLSLLTQLPSHSGFRSDTLSQLHSHHSDGARQPSDYILTQCLKKMLKLPDQLPTYLIMDALDECPIVPGIPSPREQVLQLVKELADLHICVTSRPELDIRNGLESLTSHRVSLHDQSGQKKDIEDHARPIIYSDSEQVMRRWGKEDKELLIATLSERAEIGATSHGPDVTPPTNPVHSSFRPTDTSPTVVVSPAPQDITSTNTQSHPLEGNEQQDSDIVVPSVELRSSQSLSTASTPAAAPRLASIPTSLPNMPSKSYVASVSSVSPPSISSSIPALGSIGSATLPRLRARGLVNTGNMCFANTVLQLLVNLPPSQNLFTELCDKEMRRAGVFETGGGVTPLVDATVRFFKEFMVEEESPSTRQRSQPATGRISRADGEKEDDYVVGPFEPTYMYDAMKEKRQLKVLLVRFRAHVATSRY